MLSAARVLAARALVTAARAIIPTIPFVDAEVEETSNVPGPSISAKGIAMLAQAEVAVPKADEIAPLAGSVASRMKRF